MRQRGSTLLEVLVAAAIAITIAAAVFSLGAGARMFALRSALSQTDAAIAYAQALAATSGNGATLAFGSRVDGAGNALAGFTLAVYSGRPTAGGALRLAVPAVQSAAQVRESTLGGVPFAVFFDGAGHASAASGGLTSGTVLPADPGCPAGEASVTLALSDGRGSAVRALPCAEKR